MAKAGFIIANVAVLDKQQGSFKQVTSAGAVKNDLVISAYKPRQNFEERFREQAGQGFEEEFVQMHLFHLPPEPSVERTEQMLYSKLLAYYVQRGLIPSPMTRASSMPCCTAVLSSKTAFGSIPNRSTPITNTKRK